MSMAERFVGAPRARAELGWPRLLSFGLLLAAAAIFVTGLLVEAPADRFGWDFRYQYFAGAEDVIAGRPLYLAPDDVVLDQALGQISAYVYPPQLAVALVPLTPLPIDAATVLALVASLAALMGALAVLGVRDPRCYAAVLVWAPTIGALTVINLTPFLVLALAVAWRLRATVWPLAVALGVAASAKLFLWPILVWAVATRRLRAALLAVVVGVGVTFGAWAVIGFQGLAGYAGLLRKLGEKHAENSYSIVGMAAEVGLSDAVGLLLTLGAGVGLLVMCVAFARRDDDLRSLTCALGAALALSPIVWLHYLALLLVPLAVARPRFSWIWLVPALLWVSPQPGYTEGFATFVPAIAAVVLLAPILARPRQEGVVVGAEVRA